MSLFAATARRLLKLLQRTAPPISTARVFVAIAVPVCVLAAGIVAYEVRDAWQDRDSRIAETRVKTDNLLRSVASFVDRVMYAADIQLLDIADRVQQGATRPENVARLNDYLKRSVEHANVLAGLTVIGPTGELLASSVDFVGKPNFTDRSYFEHHREVTDDGLHIEGPFAGRFRDRPILAMTRGLRNPDGSFAGVVFVSLGISAIQDFFDSLDMGESGAVQLLTHDGTIIVRRPYLAANVGRSIKDGPLFTTYLPQSPSGSVRGTSPIDGITRWNSYRTLDNGLVILAALAEVEELANWRRTTRNRLLGLSAILALVVGSSLYLAKQIRDRLVAEEEGRRKAAEYRLLADNSSDVIIRSDLDGVRTFVSPSVQKVLGYQPAELLGRAPDAILHPDDLPQLHAAFARLRAGGPDETVTARILRKDGVFVWAETRITTMRAGDGKPVQFVASLRDISRRHRIQIELEEAKVAAEAAARAKSIFLANMSHEIRTPLNGVLGMAQLARSKARDPELKGYLEKIGLSGATLLHVVDDILDFSKIEAGMLHLERATFGIRAVLDMAVTSVAPALERKKLEFCLEVGPDVPVAVVGDSHRIGQILLNLLSNAAKFTAQGSVALAVRVAKQSTTRPTLEFCVRDSGIGMTPEEQRRLFQPFSQADSSTTRRFGGTGLGLAIVAELVSLMGGHIELQSEKGVGSSFSVFLPLELPDRNQLPASSQPEPGLSRYPLAGLNLLLVEDSEINQQVASEMLTDGGATVTLAESGLAAVEAVLNSRQRFDCVLMDVQMPDMDGIEATRRIRAEIGAASLPIIAMTAHTLSEERERCLAAGMNDHIAKPVAQSNLYKVLLRWTRPSRAEPAKPVAAGPAQADLPPAIDFASAVERMGGREPLLRRMIAAFQESQATADAKLTALIDAGQAEQAAEMLHNLRGIAGTVGADRLAAAAEELEAALRGGDGADRATCLAAFRQTLRESLAAAEALAATA